MITHTIFTYYISPLILSPFLQSKRRNHKLSLNFEITITKRFMLKIQRLTNASLPKIHLLKD